MSLQRTSGSQPALPQPQRGETVVITHDPKLPVVSVQAVLRRAEDMGLVRIADRSRGTDRESVDQAPATIQGMQAQPGLEQAQSVPVIDTGTVEIQIAGWHREAIADFKGVRDRIAIALARLLGRLRRRDDRLLSQRDPAGERGNQTQSHRRKYRSTFEP